MSEWNPSMLGGRAVEGRRFRKKPVEIRAVQFDPDNPSDALRFIGILRGDVDFHAPSEKHLPVLIIPTMEGDMRCSPGDWIIKGVQGEFYACKPDIFAQTYEEVK